MINPPDDLLEDLQAALPPEQPVLVPRPTSTTSGGSGKNQDRNKSMSPLHDHLDQLSFSDEPARASASSNVSWWCGGGVCVCVCAGGRVCV